LGESWDRLCGDDVFANRLASSEEDIQIGSIAIGREVFGRNSAPVQVIMSVWLRNKARLKIDKDIQVTVDQPRLEGLVRNFLDPKLDLSGARLLCITTPTALLIRRRLLLARIVVSRTAIALLLRRRGLLAAALARAAHESAKRCSRHSDTISLWMLCRGLDLKR
jgi:hypothetical protein